MYYFLRKRPTIVAQSRYLQLESCPRCSPLSGKIKETMLERATFTQNDLFACFFTLLTAMAFTRDVFPAF